MDALAVHLDRWDAFSQDDDLRSRLGPLFRGPDSDWVRIEYAVGAAQALAVAVADARPAERLLADEAARSDAHALCRRVVAGMREISRAPAWALLPTEDFAAPGDTLAKLPPRWPLEQASQLLPPMVRQAMPLEQLCEQIEAWLSARALEREIAADAPGRKLLGPLWKGLATDIPAATAAQKWAQSGAAMPAPALEWLAGGGADDRVAERSRKMAAECRALQSALAAVAEICTALRRWGILDEEQWFRQPCARGLRGFAEKLSAALDHEGWLPAVADFHRRRLALEQAGVGAAALNKQLGASGDWGAGFGFSLYLRLAEQAEAEHPELRDFHGEAHEGARKRFAEVDKKLFDLQGREISARLAAAPLPAGGSGGRVADLSGMGFVQHYLQLKKRRPGARRTVAQAGPALQALQPCFLMSPLQVAQCLPRDFGFDLVVMDEASQVRPGEALGALLRVPRTVIVGDSKQLPPTAFFRRLFPGASDGDGDAAPMEEMESVLDACAAAGWPVRRLLWHYRSRHESLIAFSNSEFYGQELILFPSPRAAGAEFGVKRHFVDAPCYKSGRNIAEGQEVIEALRTLLIRNMRFPERRESVGVGTVNFEQKDWLDEELRALAKRSEDFRLAWDLDATLPEPAFVKNLEALQGDERDVILISTVYGPERAGGGVAQRFGPINTDGGWRRLNVLFTRARKRIELFTSLRAAEVVPDGKSAGVKALHDYLAFAETGALPAAGRETGRPADSPFEQAVAAVLRDRGYDVANQVGVAGYFIDLGVRRPGSGGDFMLGIECDGWMYHSGRSARERDWLREQILRDQGWRLHRIWSPDWYHRRAAEIERLLAAVRAAEAAG